MKESQSTAERIPSSLYPALRKFTVTITAEINNINGFDSCDAIQTPFISALLQRFQIDGWKVSAEAKYTNDS